MNIGFISLGCSKNLVDSENIMGVLKDAGCVIVNDPKQADVLMVNTCGFIDPAKEESVNTILEMAEYKQGRCRKLIVFGCLAKRYKVQLMDELPEVDRFIGVDEYKNMAAILTEELGLEFNQYGKSKRLMSTKPWMGYLKIAEGCSNRCTYCAIPLIRGDYVSYPMDQLIIEAKMMATQGVKELVLIAQDTTRYGIDLYQECKLKDLLKELNAIEGIHWIRILYMYPDTLTPELIQAMKACDKVLPYFDIPLQHGDDEMLKLMNRRGTIQSVKDSIQLIKETFEMPVFRSTMIVGFPQENDVHFKNMLNLMSEVEFDRLGAFTYSKEEDTPAYDMPNEVPVETQEARLHELMQLQQGISLQKNQELVGKTLEVLIENVDGLSGRYLGRSVHSAPDGIDGFIYFTSDQDHELGTFTHVYIERAQDYDCYGKAVN